MWLIPSFKKYELEKTQQSINVIERFIDAKREYIAKIALDWAIWDNMYKYVNRSDFRKEFEKSDFSKTTFTDLGIDIFFIADKNKKVLWGYKCGCPNEISDKAFYENKEKINEVLSIEDELEYKNKILKINDKKYIYTAVKIRDTNRKKPYNGYLLVGTEVNSSLIEEILKSVGKKVYYYDNEKEIPFEFQPYLIDDHIDYKTINIKEKEIRSIFSYPEDEISDNILYLEIKEPVDMLLRGYKLAIYISVTIFLIGMLFVIMSGYMIEKSYIVPLENIKSDIENIIKRKELIKSNKTYSAKEVNNLKTVIYKMVRFLQEDRQVDAQTLYTQGQDDIKAGILHNTKNSLTPIALSLEDLLYIMKKHGDILNDANQAVKKLRDEELDKDLEDDIKEYLSIVISKFVKFKRMVEGKLENALDMMEITEGMLSSKNLSRSNEVYVKKVNLKSVVERVVNEHKRNNKNSKIVYKIDINASLFVETSPVYLEHVLINIISNSVYSIKHSGNKDKGEVVIIAKKLEEKEMLILIKDNGIGISEKNLLKVFRRGFSTKRGFRQSGEGLHWTASVVQKIGGNITVDSDGVGKGAEARITLPINRKL
jgi:signal transduction histidine kinase